jgi:hypothetical protein
VQSKYNAARRTDAHCRLAELHAVEVLLEDLLLVEMSLDSQRPERLRELPSPSRRAGCMRRLSCIVIV